MNTQLLKFFLEQASDIFKFLVTDHSFEKPKLEIDEAIHFATVIFFRRDIAFECILDERESDVTCKIAKVVNGQKVTYYAIDDNGERVRDDVASILRRKGIRKRLFTELSNRMKLEDIIKITLLDYAKMLRKYDQELLSGKKEGSGERGVTH